MTTTTTKEYSVVGTGSYGPAHPMHNPACRIYVDGQYVHTAANGREAHLWAIRMGFTPRRKDLLDNPAYQILMAEAAND